MTTLQAMLVFLGVPLAIVGVIVAAVFVAAPRDQRRDAPGPPVGTALASHPCAVDESGTHEEAAPGDCGPRCWTLACAECRTPYQEGGSAVHFTSAEHAVAVACARGWVQAGHRMRCRNCS